MATVKQILDRKGRQVSTITADKSVFEALRLMGEKEIGALAVVEGEALVGILSERDYARKVVLKGKTSRETLVGAIMSSPAISVTPAQSVEECMAIMTEQRIRHLPVMDEGSVVGMLSIGDLVKEIISHHEHVIKDMKLERLILFAQGTYSC